MHVSIGKLAALSISLLIIVSFVTTGAGLYVLQSHHQSVESHHAAAARDLVRNAAIAMRDHIQFYQGVPRLMPPKRESADPAGPTGLTGTTSRPLAAQELLERMMEPNDRFVILDADGRETLSIGAPATIADYRTHRAHIPDTPWRLVLHRPGPRLDSPLVGVVIFNTLILLAVALMSIAMIRVVLGYFRADLAGVVAALEQALSGRLNRNPAPASIDEIGTLYPPIERLAEKIDYRHEKEQNHSLSDALTGVFNRRYFDLMLAHLHEQSERQLPATLAIINLNDFKQINEQFGREDGDRILQNVACYLLSRVRATDIVVRLGGDEFGLLLTNMAGAMLEDWLAALVHDYDHQALENSDKGRLFCQFSVGVAQIDTQTYPVPFAVFNAAQSAMYAAKHRRQVPHSRYAIAGPGKVTSLIPRREAL